LDSFQGISLRLRPRGPTTALDPSPTIPSLVELFVPMHRARGRLVAPPADGRLLRMRGGSGPKGRTPAGAPATPEATSRSGGRHSPHLSAASASAAAAVSAARDTDDVEVCIGESQPLLSPPARVVHLRLGTGDSVRLAARGARAMSASGVRYSRASPLPG